jgi:hypothetical protein
VVVPPTLTKAFGTGSIPFGGSTTLAFRATNPNATVTLRGIVFTDALPVGIVISTPNGLTGSCGGGTITAVAGTNTVILSTAAAATLAAGGSCTFSVLVTAVAIGTQTNTTSTISSTEGGSGPTATATVTVTRAPTTTTIVAVPTSAGFVPRSPRDSGPIRPQRKRDQPDGISGDRVRGRRRPA